MESSFLIPAKAVEAAKIHEGMKVADFGAGSGFFARAAARAVGSGGVVWAVDANHELLTRLRALGIAEGLRNIEVVAGDIEGRGGSGLPEDMFDVIIASNIFFSAEDRPALVEEIFRVLKRGGRALVIDWKGSFGGLGPHTSHVVEEKEARPLFERGGSFVFEREVPAGLYHWGFLMRKK